LFPLTSYVFVEQAAANADFPCAIGSLAQCYESGHGTAINTDLSHDLHTKAAELGWAPSIRALGAEHERAGCMNEALEHYGRASKLGDADAFHELGRCARLGKGRPQNVMDAKRYCRSAINLGRLECHECVKVRRSEISINRSALKKN
jgi:TPR repeat protein